MIRLLCAFWLVCCGVAWGHLPQASHTAYYHEDGAGNVTALMDAQEGIAARYLYSPFGRVTGQWGSMADANRYRFSSKEVHAASGLSYYGLRFYDAGLQRWLNPDPLGEAGGINLFGFVSNDPLTRIDPFGESDENRPPVVVFPPSSGLLPLFGPPAREPQIAQGDVGSPLVMLDLQRVMNYLLDPIVPVQHQYLYHDNTPPGFVALGMPGPPGGLGKMPCRNAAKAADPLRRHHAWPKYLDGAERQDLVPLPKSLHDSFHSGLDKILPRQKGTAFYDSLSGPARDRVLRDLADYTKAFDAKHGTSLYEAMLKEGFPLP